MFEQTGFKESCLCQTQIIDIQLITLKALVKYIYTDVVDPENDNIKELFVAADKYDIQGLRARCESILAAELNVENAAEIYFFSFLYGEGLLKEKSIDLVAKNFRSVKLTPKWIELKNNPSMGPAIEQVMDYMSGLI